MAAAAGNQYAANGRRWRDAIEKALARRIADGRLKGLEDLADKLLDAVMLGDMTAVKELGDRYDGKPKQTIGGDAESPLYFQRVEQVIIDPGAQNRGSEGA